MLKLRSARLLLPSAVVVAAVLAGCPGGQECTSDGDCDSTSDTPVCQPTWYPATTQPADESGWSSYCAAPCAPAEEAEGNEIICDEGSTCGADGVCVIDDGEPEPSDGGSPEPDDGGVPDGGSPEPEPGDGGVDDVVITNFTVDVQNNTAVDGADVTFSWMVENADACTLKEGTLAAVDVTGMSHQLTPNTGEAVNNNGDIDYVLSCTGPEGPAESTLTLSLVGALIEADDDTLNIGDSTTLMYSTIGNAACSLTSGGVDVTDDTVSPTEDTTYTYSCERNGVTAEDSVVVQVAFVGATAPAAALADSSVVIDVASAHATDCGITPDGAGRAALVVDGDGNGSYDVDPVLGGPLTYTVDCMSAFGGTVSAELDVVGVGFVASLPGYIAIAGQDMLTWQTHNEQTVCTATVDDVDVGVDLVQAGVDFTLSNLVAGEYVISCAFGEGQDALTFGHQFLGVPNVSVSAVYVDVVDTVTGGPEVRVDASDTIPGTVCVQTLNGTVVESNNFGPDGAGQVPALTPGINTLSVSCLNQISETASAPLSVQVWSGEFDKDDLAAFAPDVDAPLVAIDGNTYFLSADALSDADLGRLDSVVEVDGEVQITGLTVSVIGDPVNSIFGALQRTSGRFHLSNSSTAIVDLASLVSVGGAFEVNTNASLTTLTASELASVGGAFSLSSNSVMGNVVLNNLVEVGTNDTLDDEGRRFFFNNNGSASYLAEFGALLSVGGDFVVASCDGLTSFTADKMTQVGGFFEVEDNTSLTSIDIDDLEGVVGHLRIRDNTALPCSEVDPVTDGVNSPAPSSWGLTNNDNMEECVAP